MLLLKNLAKFKLIAFFTDKYEDALKAEKEAAATTTEDESEYQLRFGKRIKKKNYSRYIFYSSVKRL